MDLKAIKTELGKMKLQLEQFQASEYQVSRALDGNLKLNFNDGYHIELPLFPLRPYQLEVQRKLFIEGFKRIFLVRPRRAGKEVESWTMILEAAIESPGLYMMIYPTNVRARLVLWDGAILLSDGTSLKFLDMIPRKLIVSINQQDMTIKLINGSIIKILGSDTDPDKLRGINVRGVVFSEYAFADPRVYHIIMPVLRQNGGWVILQTTFNGMNHAYRYMKEIQSNPDWYTRIDSVKTLVNEKGERYVTDEMIDEDRRSGMPEYLIQQEYYSVVQLNQESMYFAREINHLYENNKIIPELILPGQPVYSCYDIGFNDQTAICMVQFDQNDYPNIINYIEDKNKPLEFYLNSIDHFNARHNLRDGGHFVPHDGNNKNAATGKSYADHGRDLGKYFTVVKKPATKISAIQSMRQILPHTKFNKENTVRLIDCLSNYSKEYDEKGGLYKNNPKHDWTSHGVDSFQTMTLAREAHLFHDTPSEIIYYSNG